MYRWLPRRLIAGLLAVIAAFFIADSLFPPPLERGGGISVLVTDRSGRPLRAFPTPDGRWRFLVRLEDVDPAFIEALVRVEDKRFWSHHGTDWIGLARAGVTSLSAGRIVSGGSTLTMQTARMLEPRPRNIGSKLVEIWRANQIERRLSKQEILELYLSLTPYGGNLEGVRAASWAYFGHDAGRLSAEEIALLIALPQSPEARRPDRRPQAATRARDQIAGKLAGYGLLEAAVVTEIAQIPVPSSRQAFPAEAWHGTQAVIDNTGREDVRSTIDAGLQAEVEQIALVHAEAEGRDVQVAALVVHIPTRAVRALVGSASRDRAGGWLDLTDRPRSPGSTLKPFIYAMAFDEGVAGSDTRIRDLPRRFSGYQPENFDRTFQGDVRLADALQHSLNIPAVLVLDRVGPERFSARLSSVGAHPRLGGGAGQTAGLALALGGAGMTGRELAMLYAALGDGGIARPLVWTAADEMAGAAGPGHRLVSESSAAEILQILEGTPAPDGRVPGRLTRDAPHVAFKTGTSYGFRDAWALGVSGQHVIMVWVGRADGAARTGVTGRHIALPILFELADRSGRHLRDEVRVASAPDALPLPPPDGPLRVFSPQGAPEILFPPDNAQLWAGRVAGRAPRPFVLAGRGEGPLEWFIDGEPCPRDEAGVPVWQPILPGFYTISAVDPVGRMTSVRIRVLGEEPV